VGSNDTSQTASRRAEDSPSPFLGVELIRRQSFEQQRIGGNRTGRCGEGLFPALAWGGGPRQLPIGLVLRAVPQYRRTRMLYDRFRNTDSTGIADTHQFDSHKLPPVVFASDYIAITGTLPVQTVFRKGGTRRAPGCAPCPVDGQTPVAALLDNAT
jgi:hypothetical protein